MKVILLTAIESLREEKKKTKKKKKKQKNKRREGKPQRTAISRKDSTPRSASLDVASVETAEAWSEHSERKSRYQWISGFKMLGK